MTASALVRLAVFAACAGAATSALAAANCDTLAPCAARACRIDAELATPKAQGNPKLKASLERDRRELAHCSDDGLAQKRKMALDQAKRRVDQRGAELEKAQAGGDAGKVARAERRLESAKKSYADMERAPL